MGRPNGANCPSEPGRGLSLWRGSARLLLSGDGMKNRNRRGRRPRRPPKNASHFSDTVPNCRFAVGSSGTPTPTGSFVYDNDRAAPSACASHPPERRGRRSLPIKKGETQCESLLLSFYSIPINASAYSAPVAAEPSDLTSTVHAAMAFSSFSAAETRQMWRRSMAAALMMEAGLA